jgi:beta-glucosidase
VSHVPHNDVTAHDVPADSARLGGPPPRSGRGRSSRWLRSRLVWAPVLAIAIVATAVPSMASILRHPASPSPGTAGCDGLQLTGAVSSSQLVQPPQTVPVTETLSESCGLKATHIAVYLTAPQGWTVSPAGPQLAPDVRPGGHATLSWQVQVPAGASATGLTTQAIYDTGPHSTDSTQASVPVSVAYSSVAAAFNNVAITSDTDTGPGNIDGSGYSLSAQALAAAGVTPGSTVTSGGLSYTWPDVSAGQPDNIVADGRAVLLSGTGPTLGFLVTGTYGPASGTGTIEYADGTSQAFTLTAPDWYNTPPAASAPVISMAYRNEPANAQEQHTVNVYAVTVPLAPGKTVSAVILPDVSAATPAAGSPALHVFAIAIG